MDALYQRSIEIILQNQAESGAYVASPNFPAYRYCWFRDGSYIAYAMDLAREHESSRRFHEWVAARLNERSGIVRRAIDRHRAGQPLADGDVLHTRYKVDGSDVEENGWGNFQLDGLGTWLWALDAHHKRYPNVPLPDDILHAASLTADYLSALWAVPCFDCWEEHPEHEHPYTLAAIYGGLRAHSALSGADHSPVTTAIHDALITGARGFGHFVKFPGSPRVDASLLGLSVPYGVVAPDDPLMQATLEHIEATLLRGGGLHRYEDDTYYGGGAWLLLSAWLGWYYAERLALRPRAAAEFASKISDLRAWIRFRATPHLELPEQVAEHLSSPDDFPTWLKRWGPIATPLLWSHAAYIILLARLDSLGLTVSD